ncbi:HAD family hydrolase [Microlunatus antarcticus]|uniref:Uncharacterized protein n=1 Tax=Microlunatus antarcticus TaxID=53388 RepID=A0A7W5JRM3_9ACTN|nr:hypothetical protein [Microlunatus antarcticus]
MSDLDGTLLGANSAISPTSVRLLNEAVAAGALFTYATARSFTSSSRVTEGLHLSIPVVTCGGTITADPDDGAPRHVQLLDESVARIISAECGRTGAVEPVWFTFEDGRDWVRWRPDRMTAGVETFTAHRAGDRRLRPITVDDPLDHASVFYITIIAARPSLVTLREALAGPLRSTAHFLNEDPNTPGLDWLEVHNQDGTKAQAVQRLMSDLRAGRLVVFGDNHNDVPMFAVADQGFAVANAVTELKAVATAVIGRHDTDAVARHIAADHQAHVEARAG